MEIVNNKIRTDKKCFYQKYLIGKISLNDIEDYIDEWHEKLPPIDLKLHEYLGLSWNQYIKYARCNEIDKPKKFICVQKCPELDCDNSNHCVDTQEGIQEREERVLDYCPCGNDPIWEEIKE